MKDKDREDQRVNDFLGLDPDEQQRIYGMCQVHKKDTVRENFETMWKNQHLMSAKSNGDMKLFSEMVFRCGYKLSQEEHNEM